MALTMGGQYPNKMTVWQNEDKGKYSEVKLSSSKKKADGSGYETDFSCKVRFIGNAHDKAKSLKEKDKITLTNISVSAKWSSEKNQMLFSIACFDFDMVEQAQGGSAPDGNFMDVPDGIENDLPFK